MSTIRTQPDSYLVDHLLSNIDKKNSLIVLGEGFNRKKLYKIKERTFKIITNRYDTYTDLKDKDFDVKFSDFELSEGFSLLYLRILKDKPANFYILNQAAEKLPIGGSLIITGNRNEGIKTYVKSAEDRLGSITENRILGNGTRLSIITKTNKVSESLNDKNYSDLRNNIIPGYSKIFTKPGLFGWQKEDAGSKFLLDSIDIEKGSKLLDLGCGYGYLSVRAWDMGAGVIYASDNNAAAVTACSRNFSEYGIKGDVFADDCGSSITEKFDMILCNPPFHTGHQESRGITIKFMKAIKKHLSKSGMAFIVVNIFVGVEKVLDELGLYYSEVNKNRQFKILQIRQ